MCDIEGLRHGPSMPIDFYVKYIIRTLCFRQVSKSVRSVVNFDCFCLKTNLQPFGQLLK